MKKIYALNGKFCILVKKVSKKVLVNKKLFLYLHHD